MRRNSPLVLAVLAALTAFPLAARDRHESYVTYDDGGTVVRQEGDREVAGRVNLPVFPGDEIVTNRRGRVEVRLADRNIVGIDRSTALLFESIRDSFDVESNETVARIAYGQVMIFRLNDNSAALRLDSSNASYVSSRSGVYAVETDRGGDDVVSVYEGSLEVRSRSGKTRLRAGEQANVDGNGVYGVATVTAGGTTDFERWFLRRSERHERRASRYLDDDLSFADADLSAHGSWSYLNGLGTWGWSPRVSLGWRPYHHGSWIRGRSGALVWLADEPWGWVPYHYGRWTHHVGHGWVWIPGRSYAPAWVYWAYGPGYIGWSPAGWYDCYSPYYRWAYSPYHRYSSGIGFGFNSRIHLSGIDLTPWTFVNPGQVVSNRIDRAALSTDDIRNRLQRDGDRAVVSSIPARFGQNEDPAAAVTRIARNGLGGSTGNGSSGTTTDMTPFFRRDPELSSAVRDRIVRSRPLDETPAASRLRAGGEPGARAGTEGAGRIIRGDNPAPGVSGEERSRLSRGAGSGEPVTPRAPETGNEGERRRVITRGERRAADPETGTGDGTGSLRRNGGGEQDSEQWRRRGIERSRETAPPLRSEDPAPPQEEGWRDRGGSEAWSELIIRRRSSSPQDRETPDVRPETGDDTPRRVIDAIGARGSRPAGGEARPPETPRRERINRPSGGGSEGQSQRIVRPTPPPSSAPPRSDPPPRRSDSPGEGKTNIKTDD